MGLIPATDDPRGTIAFWSLIAMVAGYAMVDSFDNGWGFLVGGVALFIFLSIGGSYVIDDIQNFSAKHGQPREVHHYHRITLDQHGNAVEVTDYEERH